MTLYDMDALLNQMTPHMLRLLQAMYDAGGRWMTRANVAKAIGKKRLTPYDINCLKALADKGLLAESTQETTAPGSDFAYVYTMTDQVAEMLAEWWEIRETQVRQPIIAEVPRKPIRLFVD